MKTLIVGLIIFVLSGAYFVISCNITHAQTWAQRQVYHQQQENSRRIDRYNEQIIQNQQQWQRDYQKQAREDFNADKYGNGWSSSDDPNSQYNGNHSDWHND